MSARLRGIAQGLAKSQHRLLLLGIPAVLGFISTPIVALRWHGFAGVTVGCSLVVLTLVLVIGHVGGDERARW